jgi:hypothetical protein
MIRLQVIYVSQKLQKTADPGTAAYCGKCQSQLQPLFAIISIRQLG